MMWVKNYSNYPSGKKATSNWHILHSMRTSNVKGFALTMCGYMFDGPRLVDSDEPPAPRKKHHWGRVDICSNCKAVDWALSHSEEIPRELWIVE